MPKLRTVPATSAGGVVLARTERGLEVALCGRVEPCVWTLPKGTPRRNETMEQVARREVGEETGLLVHNLGSLGSIEYWFVRGGVRFHKVVHYYLMRPLGGDISQHDEEYDVVEWFPVEQALALLAYDNEKEVVRRGMEMAEKVGLGE